MWVQIVSWAISKGKKTRRRSHTNSKHSAPEQSGGSTSQTVEEPARPRSRTGQTATEKKTADNGFLRKKKTNENTVI